MSVPRVRPARREVGDRLLRASLRGVPPRPLGRSRWEGAAQSAEGGRPRSGESGPEGESPWTAAGKWD